MVKYLIGTCNVDKEKKDCDGWTPLHFASYIGDLRIVKYLIEKYQVDQEAKTNKDQTAYDLALNSKKKNVINYLKSKALANKEAEIDLTDDDKFQDQVGYHF